jgi:hypothetical protein
LSVVPGDDDRSGEKDEIPHRGLLATLPKRSLARVLVLLAALAGIIYLRQRTASIASCMSEAFRAPAPVGPARTSATIRASVVLPPDASAKAH